MGTHLLEVQLFSASSASFPQVHLRLDPERQPRESWAEGAGQAATDLSLRSSLGFHYRSPLHSNILKDQINQGQRRLGEQSLLALAAALSKLLLAVEDAALVRLSLPHAL